MTVETLQVPVYRPFAVRVARLQRLSPSFLRVTFTGADLADFAPNGCDQRIKVLLPLPGRGVVDCPAGPDWYGEWRALPDERQHARSAPTPCAPGGRTRGEVDVDFVLHGATGPASAWAETGRRRRRGRADRRRTPASPARPAASSGTRRPTPRCLLLAGDETAVPAICAIVESLPAGQRARVLLEVPTAADVLHVARARRA